MPHGADDEKQARAITGEAANNTLYQIRATIGCLRTGSEDGVTYQPLALAGALQLIDQQLAQLNGQIASMAG